MMTPDKIRNLGANDSDTWPGLLREAAERQYNRSEPFESGGGMGRSSEYFGMFLAGALAVAEAQRATVETPREMAVRVLHLIDSLDVATGFMDSPSEEARRSYHRAKESLTAALMHIRQGEHLAMGGVSGYST